METKARDSGVGGGRSREEWALIGVDSVLAANAFAGAWYGLAGARDVPARRARSR
jgi:hypothetical protein